MLAKCANPACSAPFLYLREGKLYQMEVGTSPSAGAPDHQLVPRDARSARRLEFFWLCGNCARRMTLVSQGGSGIVVVPLGTQRAVAS